MCHMSIKHPDLHTLTVLSTLKHKGHYFLLLWSLKMCNPRVSPLLIVLLQLLLFLVTGQQIEGYLSFSGLAPRQCPPPPPPHSNHRCEVQLFGPGCSTIQCALQRKGSSPKLLLQGVINLGPAMTRGGSDGEGRRRARGGYCFSVNLSLSLRVSDGGESEIER